QVPAEGPPRRAPAAAAGPVRPARRGAARPLLARLPLPARVAGRRVARAPPRGRPAARAGLDLRGAPRVVAAEPARGQPLAELPRAGRRAGRLRDRPRLHARPAAAGDAPSIPGFVGLPGHRLLRAQPAALPAR